MEESAILKLSYFINSPFKSVSIHFATIFMKKRRVSLQFLNPNLNSAAKFLHESLKIAVLCQKVISFLEKCEGWTGLNANSTFKPVLWIGL